MKKLNNKGFAITGILYTLLVIFLLVLVFSLQILRANKNMKEKSIEKLESTYEGIKVENDTINDKGEVLYNGKYIFELTVKDESNNEQHTYICTSYLKKGTNIFKEDKTKLNEESSELEENTENNQIVKYKKFIPDDCNKYELTYIDNNSIDKDVANKIKLKEVYKFEGDSNEQNS